VPHIRIGNQILHQFKGCRVEPLQIVEKQRKRVLRPGERAEETAEHHLEAILRILGRQIRNVRLFPDDELDLRDEVDDELAVRTHGLQKGVPPLAHFSFALDEDLTDQRLEGLRQDRVRDVTLVLVELACREKPTRQNQHLVQFVHHGRFADAGVTGYEHKFRCAVGNHPVERCKQSIDLALPPVQLLRDE
jgi:hypothetical protein